ncbi:hypothetical protein [Ureaplasma zalophigenitalium]|uniref:Uncharacterized protein n=1 Tax=Ureaplasma zalophigenitalium TaxID=907723 RepID=A0ABT3BP97_9BACT|nr:hypothetical protein [Ureaplasma zalophigenitalium]MCV3754091.1 hypothetical protein [Ureaplasma zalophigenitalium]
MSKSINSKKIVSIITGVLVASMFIGTITAAAVLMNKPTPKKPIKKQGAKNVETTTEKTTK